MGNLLLLKLLATSKPFSERVCRKARQLAAQREKMSNAVVGYTGASAHIMSAPMGFSVMEISVNGEPLSTYKLGCKLRLLHLTAVCAGC